MSLQLKIKYGQCLKLKISRISFNGNGHIDLKVTERIAAPIEKYFPNRLEIVRKIKIKGFMTTFLPVHTYFSESLNLPGYIDHERNSNK